MACSSSRSMGGRVATVEASLCSRDAPVLCSGWGIRPFGDRDRSAEPAGAQDVDRPGSHRIIEPSGRGRAKGGVVGKGKGEQRSSNIRMRFGRGHTTIQIHGHLMTKTALSQGLSVEK
jgi:hypothetical protein